MSSTRVWFITGASSGFGRHVTELVLENGDIAIATLRNPDALNDLASQYPTQLSVLQLDVSKPDEIRDAFAKAEELHDRIDVVFNNAGYSLLCEAESAPEETARAVLDTNFWGAVNVSKEATRFFRDVNRPAGGRLLQTSSTGGIEGYSALPYYCASKFALEGFTESLAAEIRPEWNIKITLLELGCFATNAGRNMQRLAPHPAYIDPTTQQPVARTYLYTKPSGDPKEAAKIVLRAAELADPPLHLPLGKDASEVLKRKGESLIMYAEKYEPWSENLELVAPDLGLLRQKR